MRRLGSLHTKEPDVALETIEKLGKHLIADQDINQITI
jgi:hypothetical protein